MPIIIIAILYIIKIFIDSYNITYNWYLVIITAFISLIIGITVNYLLFDKEEKKKIKNTIYNLIKKKGN